MPTNTYTALATITLTGTDTEVVFGSIPSGYRDLIFVFNGSASGTIETLFRVNSDTGSSYPQVAMRGLGSGTPSSAASTEAAVYTYGRVTTVRGSIIYQLFDYSVTDKHKTILGRGDSSDHSTTAVAARWASNTAINTISLTAASGNFTIGSTFSLWGIAA